MKTYKILHLATGTYVMGNHGEDLCFISKQELLTRIFDSKFTVFVRVRGDRDHYTQIASILGLDSSDILPKHEFEIIEFPDV